MGRQNLDWKEEEQSWMIVDFISSPQVRLRINSSSIESFALNLETETRATSLSRVVKL